MKINTVQDLINELNLIEDKTMPITLYSNYDYERYNNVQITIIKFRLLLLKKMKTVTI